MGESLFCGMDKKLRDKCGVVSILVDTRVKDLAWDLNQHKKDSRGEEETKLLMAFSEFLGS